MSSFPEPPAVIDDDFLRDLDLRVMPGYLFRRLDSLATGMYETYTGNSRLTPRQFGLLLIVSQSGAITQSLLARRLHVDPSTLGEMLTRMTDRKLVERSAAAHDRRTSEITLTPLGRRTLSEHVRGALAAQEAILAPLPDYLRPVFLKCAEILAYAEDEPNATADRPPGAAGAQRATG